MKQHKREVGQLGGVIVLILIFAIGSIWVPGFRQPGMYFSILTQASLTGILSLGMLFVVICGDIDLSIGAQLTCYGIICTRLASFVPLPLALCAMFLVAVVYGLLLGYCAQKFAHSSLITSIAGGAMLAGFTEVLIKGAPLFRVPAALERTMTLRFGNLSFAAVVFLVLAVVSAVVLHVLYIGKRFYAVGTSRFHAQEAGVNVMRTRMIAFACCSVFCAVCALLLMGRIGVATSSSGGDTVFRVLVVLALGGARFSGGKGRVMSTVIAAFLVQLISSALLALRIASYWQVLLYAVILLLSMASAHRKS